MQTFEQVCALEGHKDRAWHVSWRFDGKLLASCSGDKTIRIWSPPKTTNAAASGSNAKWECVAILEDAQGRTIRACEWSPDGRFIASVSFDATTVVWEKQGNSYEVVSSLEGHESEVKSVAWSPSGSYIATCSRDKSVWIWEADPDTDFECISVLHGHTQDVKFVKWHPTEDILISASYDDTVRIWAENEDDWYCKETLSGHGSTVWGVATDPQGSRIASVSDDKSVIIWQRDPNSKDVHADGSPMEWKQAATLSGFHERTIFSVDWSKEGNYIATGAADDAIRIFCERSGASSSAALPSGSSPSFDLAFRQIDAHSSDINCVRWSPEVQHDANGKRSFLLASAADDALIRIWRFTSEEFFFSEMAILNIIEDARMSLLPEELHAEQRWSSFQDRNPQHWSAATDEKLMVVVTRSTASGERFPVGVNWLEVSSMVGHSPVECVKRYALLHQCRDQQQQQHGAVESDIVGNELHPCACVLLPSPVAGVHQPPPQEEERQDEQEEVRSAPFSGLSSGEDIGSPRQQSFSDFSTPLTSPKLSSLDNSDEFGIGIGSPSSPPPFAVRNAKQTGAGAVSSPFRWENLAHESGYASPVLKSPRHGRHRVSHLHGPFGIDDETKSDASQSSINSSPNAVMSPRIVHGTQDHTRPLSDPQYAANIINHAFKGLKIDAPPTASSPRMIRTFSNSEYPFLKDDDARKAAQSARHDVGPAPAFLSSPPASNTPILSSEQQLQAHMMRMSAMSNMSSFHGDTLFSGSLTQSALEDAFLDMAGSRLDASSVLLNSRFSMGHSRMRLDQIQALEKEREKLRDAGSAYPSS